MVTVLALAAIGAILVVASLSLARNATSGSGHEARGAVALQAADAGVSAYMARLAHDPDYHLTFVDPAEDPRVPAGGGAAVGPGEAWPGGAWTYAGSPVSFAELHDVSARYGTAEYGLRVYTDAQAGPDAITIQSLGRVGGDRPDPLSRAVQVRVRPATLARFQMVSDASITLAESVSTDGQIYSNDDVNHRGTATGPLYAQGTVCDEGSGAGLLDIVTRDGSTPCAGVSETGDFPGGAFDSVSSPSISDELSGPVDLDRFEEARLALRAAAQSGGLYFDSTTASTGGLLEGLLGTLGLAGWMAQLLEDPAGGPGQIRVYPIVNLDIPLVSTVLDLLGLSLPVALPVLGCGETYDLPDNGAVYFEQSVVVSSKLEASLLCGGDSVLGSAESVVDGEVTIGSGHDIQIGGDITYAATGDNVLGLLAERDVGISALAIDADDPLGSDIQVRAASVAIDGEWRTGLPVGIAVPIVAPEGLLHGTLSYTGMMGTRQGFDVSQYQATELVYDPSLAELPPPFFPSFDGGFVAGYWREVEPPAA